MNIKGHKIFSCIVKKDSPFFMSDLVIFILFAIVIFVLYGYSFPNAFISDDIPTVRGVHNFNELFSSVRFLPTLIYQIIYAIGGPIPTFFRLSNIIFHIGSTFILFKIVEFLSQRSLGFMASMLFAVHPILVESVAWISGGIYAQYGFFLLLAFYLYIRSKIKPLYVIYSAVMYACALFFTDKSVVFMGLLLLYELVYGNIRKSWRKLLIFATMTGMSIFLTFGLLSARVSQVENVNGGTVNWDNPIIYFTSTIFLYLGLILWPLRLTIYHSNPMITIGWIVEVSLITICYIAFVLVSLKKNKMLSFWLLFFLFSLFTVLSPYRITWIIAERYAYLATAGIMVVIASILTYLIHIRHFQVLGISLWMIIVLLFSVRTFWRIMDWRSDKTFWLATVAASPNEPKSHNSLAGIYAEHGEITQAIREFEIATKVKPSYAPAYYNLGVVYETINDRVNALKYYKQALYLVPKNKDAQNAILRLEQQ